LVVESNEPLGELLRQFSTRVQNYDSLRHRFRRTFGCSPRQMATRVRISRARGLLIESPMSIKQIAAAVGFESPFYFSLRFKARTKKSPKAFRESLP